jgi:hypothetical protein
VAGDRVGGAYICERWELRVTARCLIEDLGQPATADFDAIRELPIVKAL